MKTLQTCTASAVSRAMLKTAIVLCALCALVGCEEPTEADLASDEPYLYSYDGELPPCELRTDTE